MAGTNPTSPVFSDDSRGSPGTLLSGGPSKGSSEDGIPNCADEISPHLADPMSSFFGLVRNILPWGGGGQQEPSERSEEDNGGVAACLLSMKGLSYQSARADHSLLDRCEGAIIDALGSDAGLGLPATVAEVMGGMHTCQFAIIFPEQVTQQDLQVRLTRTSNLGKIIENRIHKLQGIDVALARGADMTCEVSSAAPEGLVRFQGTWIKDTSTYIIRGSGIRFPSGGRAEMISHDNNRFSITHPSGVSFNAVLEHNGLELRWTNGSTWQRAFGEHHAEQLVGAPVSGIPVSQTGHIPGMPAGHRADHDVTATEATGDQSPSEAGPSPDLSSLAAELGPTKWGITGAQCKALLDDLKMDPLWDPDLNVEGMVMHFLNPRIEAYGIGYALLLNQEDPQQVTSLVLHAPDTSGEEVLSTVARSAGTQEVFYLSALSKFQARRPEEAVTDAELEDRSKGEQAVLQHIQAQRKARWCSRLCCGPLSWFPMFLVALAVLLFYGPIIAWGCVPTLDFSQCGARMPPQAKNFTELGQGQCRTVSGYEGDFTSAPSTTRSACEDDCNLQLSCVAYEFGGPDDENATMNTTTSYCKLHTTVISFVEATTDGTSCYVREQDLSWSSKREFIWMARYEEDWDRLPEVSHTVRSFTYVAVLGLLLVALALWGLNRRFRPHSARVLVIPGHCEKSRHDFGIGHGPSMLALDADDLKVPVVFAPGTTAPKRTHRPKPPKAAAAGAEGSEEEERERTAEKERTATSEAEAEPAAIEDEEADHVEKPEEKVLRIAAWKLRWAQSRAVFGFALLLFMMRTADLSLALAGTWPWQNALCALAGVILGVTLSVMAIFYTVRHWRGKLPLGIACLLPGGFLVVGAAILVLLAFLDVITAGTDPKPADFAGVLDLATDEAARYINPKVCSSADCIRAVALGASCAQTLLVAGASCFLVGMLNTLCCRKCLRLNHLPQGTIVTVVTLVVAVIIGFVRAAYVTGGVDGSEHQLPQAKFGLTAAVYLITQAVARCALPVCLIIRLGSLWGVAVLRPKCCGGRRKSTVRKSDIALSTRPWAAPTEGTGSSS